MSAPRALAEPALTLTDYFTRIDSLASNAGPTVFTMRARLPTQGRADMPLAATKTMSVVLKAYASGGENAVHAHPDEDHVFVVLQGSAVFSGPDGEIATLSCHQGIMLPRGALYMFQAGEEEPLVMLRIGAVIDANRPRSNRVDAKGLYMDAFSKENKEVPLLFESDALFE